MSRRLQKIATKWTFLCFVILGLPALTSAKCPSIDHSNKTLQAPANFLTTAIYALHSQFTTENFSSDEALAARAQLFDTVFNTPYWVKQAKNRQSANLLWHWIRTQYWGIVNQQGLLKEEQGYKSKINQNLHVDLEKIFKFPAFPHVISGKKFICPHRDNAYYPCDSNNLIFDVVLSPTLACSAPEFQSNMTFQYILTQTSHGWAILDVLFKGVSLIKDTYRGFEDLHNRYGNSKALAHVQRLYSLPVDKKTNPNDQPPHSGELAFNRKYKYKLPKYPLNF
ncbi:MAG: hypothetical protein M9899_09050 [Bdellovibrionaceae bacterium]|nr:hypothetical protein [Pseudobdellovibrionaceae bacterium]